MRRRTLYNELLCQYYRVENQKKQKVDGQDGGLLKFMPP